MAKVVNGTSIPNIPWEDKPEGYKDVCWRSSLNPILTRDDIEDANSLFNSSVTAYKGEFRGVFRCDKPICSHCFTRVKVKTVFIGI